MSAASATANVVTKMSWAKIVNPNPVSSPSSSVQTDVVAVIDIIQTRQDPAPATTRKPFKQEVDYVAAEMAKNFYEQCQDKIVGTARRNDLEALFNQFFPNPDREFAMVLFAMAKGFKCVNVFNRGQDLEWFKTSKTAINRAFRALKKPVQSSNGWTHVGGKVEDSPVAQSESDELVETPKAKPKETPKQNPEPTVASNFKPVPTLPETTEAAPMSLDQIVGTISALKQEITDLDNEIQALLAFHREHLREINRTTEISDKSLGQHLHEFHTASVQRLEQVLDEIQAEIDQKREKVALYCDMLKQ
jgi:hypothetical protein